MKGRKPIPEALRLIRGDAGKRNREKAKQPAAPPKDQVKPPSAPKYLSAEAKVQWRRVVKQSPPGLITTYDSVALGELCHLLAEIGKLDDALKGGLTFETESGYVQQRPEVGIRNKMATQAHRLFAEFGLTPSSRLRIGISPPSEKDALGELIGKSRRGGAS